MEPFEQVGSRGFYRPVARVTLHQAFDRMADASRAAREAGMADLLINTLGFSGYEFPSVFARYELALKLAESAGAKLRVAIVARPDVIDPQRIGVLMAQNRGVDTGTFATEPEALAWLDERATTGKHRATE